MPYNQREPLPAVAWTYTLLSLGTPRLFALELLILDDLYPIILTRRKNECNILHATIFWPFLPFHTLLVKVFACGFEIIHADTEMTETFGILKVKT